MKKITMIAIFLTFLIPASSAQAITKSLNTANNRNSCKFIKTNYQSEIMLNWAIGKAKDDDMLKEINQNIIMLSKREKLSSGTIRTAIKSWLTAEQKTKTALQDKSVDLVVKAMDLKFSSVSKFDQLCKSIQR